MSTPMTVEEKNWIDNASYLTLLEKWRFAPAGSSFFIGETAEYYTEVMREKREADPEIHTAASKHLGWK
jgi:hypothetical protein